MSVELKILSLLFLCVLSFSIFLSPLLIVQQSCLEESKANRLLSLCREANDLAIELKKRVRYEPRVMIKGDKTTHKELFVCCNRSWYISRTDLVRLVMIPPPLFSSPYFLCVSLTTECPENIMDPISGSLIFIKSAQAGVTVTDRATSKQLFWSCDKFENRLDLMRRYKQQLADPKCVERLRCEIFF
jgi:hypothetical protein